MKLHLPVRLFRAVLSLYLVGAVLSQTAQGLATASYYFGDEEVEAVSKWPTSCGLGSFGYSGYSGLREAGGAIYLMSRAMESFAFAVDKNNLVTFQSNSASDSGGAIYVTRAIYLQMNDNSSVKFTDNSAQSGGAIYGKTMMSGNQSIEFNKNEATATGGSNAAGGATCSSTLVLDNNYSIKFDGNKALASSTADSSGGAIYASGDVSLLDNRYVDFISNFAEYGGAICGGTRADILLNGNSNLKFTENEAVCGGAIYGASGSELSLLNNGTLVFSENTAYMGSALYAGEDATITIANNDSVKFVQNASSCTGVYGGAIYTEGDLSICNNDDVLFEKNVNIKNGFYQLRGLYAGGDGNEISLSAPQGKSIEFRDSIYIYAGNTVKLNQTYEGTDQTGDIVFTGKYAEEYLRSIVISSGESRTATEQEIIESRTSSVLAMANLYAGRLRVEDGAIYRGYGITAMSGSTVRLHDGSMNHFSNAINIQSGATLALRGVNSITAGSVSMSAGSTLSFHVSTKHTSEAILTLSGSLVMPQNGGGLTLQLSKDNFVSGVDSYMLLTGVTKPLGWDEYTINITSGTLGWSVSFDDLTWVDDTLWLYYDEEPPHGGGGGSEEDDKTLVYIDYSKTGDAPKGGALDATAGDKVELSGYDSILFQENYVDAEGNGKAYGGGIYASNYNYTSNPAIVISGNGSVSFIGNYAQSETGKSYGGAIYGESITLSNNGSVLFHDNVVSGKNGYGGAIYGSRVVMEENDSITFSENESVGSGGAISAFYNNESSMVSLNQNDKVEFSKNKANGYAGGAIYGEVGIEVSKNGSVEFSENSSYYGGAIWGITNIDFIGNESVEFSSNVVEADGGAIYSDYGSINLEANKSVLFEGNASEHGGAIYSSGKVNVEGSDSVAFLRNTGDSGGAVYMSYDTVTSFVDNKSVTFSENSATSYGGALYAYGSSGTHVDFSGNESIKFTENTASSGWGGHGGAMYYDYGSSLSIKDNGSVAFSHNSVTATSSAYSVDVYGGALYLDGASATIRDNESVIFSNNYAGVGETSSGCDVYGGAIYAVYDGNVSFVGNGNVVFSENRVFAESEYAYLRGGAICAIGDSEVNFRNNESVLFEKNYEGDSDGNYVLRSIYADSISLSAAEGNSVEFRDSVYISSGSTVSLNADYTEGADVVFEQLGDIIFTGAYTEAHLNEILEEVGANRLATDAEILASRTSEVRAMTNLYGGCLRVEDGAIYKGYGITVATGSNATVSVKDASLEHSGYQLSFAAGSTLQVAGVSTVTAQSLNMAEGSTLSLCVSSQNMDEAVLTLSGEFIQGGHLYVDLQMEGTSLSAGSYKLLTFDSAPTSWTAETITIQGGERWDVSFDDLVWDGQTLVWNVTNTERWWTNGTGNRIWSTSDANWVQDGVSGGFQDGDRLYFADAGSGAIKLVGELAPSAVIVDNSAKKAYTWTGSGYLSGDMSLQKSGAGTLTINTANQYSGGTILKEGTLVAGNNMAFGSDVIKVEGGTLDLKGTAVGNDIILDGSAVIKGGTKYMGQFVMESGELMKGSVLNVAQSSVFWGGVMNGTLSVSGTLVVTGAGQLGDAAKLTTNKLDVYGSLTVGTKGLCLNAKTSAITIAGGSVESAGKLSAKSLTMEGGTLEITNAKPMALTLNGVADFTAGAEVNLYGAFTAADLDMSNATFTLGMDDDDITPKNQPSVQKITLKDKTATSELTSGSMLDITGSMSVAGGLTLSDSTLSLHDWEDAQKPKAQTLTVNGNLSIADKAESKDTDAELTLNGKLTVGSLTATNADILLQNSTVQSITLTGKNASNTLSSSSITANGSMSVTGSLSLSGSTVQLEDASAKAKAMGFTVKEDFSMMGLSYLILSGKLSAHSLQMGDSHIYLLNDTAQSITLTGKNASNTLTSSSITANGSMSVTGHLSLSGTTSIMLEDTAKGKAMNLAVKGDLTLGSRSYLMLSGALSAANMTLEPGSNIYLTSTKLQTIKVSKELTFKGSITLGLQEGLAIQKGKSYNLITYKTLVGVDENTDLYTLLGLDDEYCTLTLDSKKKAITLMVTAEEWSKWVSDHAQTPAEVSEVATASIAEDAAPMTTGAAVEEAQTSEQESATVITTLPVAQAVDMEALIAKVSDTLVQTTWGTAKASRAFVDSIANRGQNATALAEGRGAAWGGVIGATSRLSSHGGSLGADHTLSGAVFGAEMNATSKHSLGMAMGVTWGEINTLSAYNVDQDSTHFALYGQSRLMQSANKGLTLDWSAAYGRSENDADMLGCSYDWTQHALQLDARLTYGYALNERTTLRGFGGVQYLHIDSDTPEKGVKADSMQDVRVEVGVGATYMATAKTSVYGEVSFIGDMVRDNPATHIGGVCRGGSSPGRAGMNLSVGATHALNESWSVNASYNMELQPRANAHNANIGATYRF